MLSPQLATTGPRRRPTRTAANFELATRMAAARYHLASQHRRTPVPRFAHSASLGSLRGTISHGAQRMASDRIDRESCRAREQVALLTLVGSHRRSASIRDHRRGMIAGALEQMSANGHRPMVSG